MPKGQYSRPFNKDLRTLQKGRINQDAKLFDKKRRSLVTQASEAMEDNRKWGARIPGNPHMEQRERSVYHEGSSTYRTGPHPEDRLRSEMK